MQAIGFLSRREHSRQELRRKLLDALRKRAREDAALAAAAEELARAAREQPSNGIDDAFTSRGSAPQAAPEAALGRGARPHGRAGASRASASETAPETTSAPPKRAPTPAGSAIDGLALASGAPLPAALRSRIVAAVALPDVDNPGHAGAGAVGGRTAPAPLQRLRDAEADPYFARLDDGEMALDGEDLALDADTFADLEPDLLPSSRRDASTPAANASDPELAGSDPEAEVDRLLDWLVANKYLSDARFVESRVNARSRKQGALRIRMELSRHGLTLEPEQAATLRETEFARARDLWQRRFGEVATDPKQRAKQARFLAARGFAADVVRRVVGGIDED
ncbi:MAG: RecX family transcriptional regulator [Burkholderiaceae bacterium]